MVFLSGSVKMREASPTGSVKKITKIRPGLSRDSILQNLVSKNSAKYESAFQLWCHLKGAAIVKVNNGPCYCSVGLIMGLSSKFQPFIPPRSAGFTNVCFCQISCSSCKCRRQGQCESGQGLECGRNAQKSLFQPISRHPNFRVTDGQTDLPTYWHTLL